MNPKIKVFQRQNPYYNDLGLIDRQRRTLIGEGRFEIPGRRAGLMARIGLVDIVHGTFGRELDLTTKGRKMLGESADDWERTFNASGPVLPVERFGSGESADRDDAKAEAEEDQADADRAKADAARMAAGPDLPIEGHTTRRVPMWSWFAKSACGPDGCTCGGTCGGCGGKAQGKEAKAKTFKIDGFARDLDHRALKRIGMRFSMHGRQGPWVENTGSFDSASEAEAEAERMAQKYRASHWPGGMAEVTGVVEFPDHPNEDDSGGVWVGVVNKFYSPS